MALNAINKGFLCFYSKNIFIPAQLTFFVPVLKQGIKEVITMKVKKDNANKYWKNMMIGNFYKKGERDSTTKQKVLAVREGYNTFAPDNCYFDFVHNLPVGVFYVDCE